MKKTAEHHDSNYTSTTISPAHIYHTGAIPRQSPSLLQDDIDTCRDVRNPIPNASPPHQYCHHQICSQYMDNTRPNFQGQVQASTGYFLIHQIYLLSVQVPKNHSRHLRRPLHSLVPHIIPILCEQQSEHF